MPTYTQYIIYYIVYIILHKTHYAFVGRLPAVRRYRLGSQLVFGLRVCFCYHEFFECPAKVCDNAINVRRTTLTSGVVND